LHNLPGWDRDDHAAAWAAFCITADLFGFAPVQTDDPRAAFETLFEPVEIDGENGAHFTGYYEPELDGRTHEIRALHQCPLCQPRRYRD